MRVPRVRLPRLLRGLFEGPRIALALRTAIAASLAWWLAPYVPFADSQYSYYAPLGVLVSMYPTLAGSARSGAQTLAGLALGIALGSAGIGVVWLGAPGIVAVALVVGLGVWLGGITALQAGRDWIAMAALFVLLLGGASPEEYSVSYLVTMAFGVAVGVIANLLLFPPLYLRRASVRLSGLRDAVAGHLHQIADAVEAGEVSPEQLETVVGDLDATVAQVTEAVHDADESSRANPRARKEGDARDLNRRRLRALERTVFSTRDLADILAHADDDQADLPDAAPALLAEAIRRTADLVAEPLGSDAARQRLDDAVDALRRYTGAIDEDARATPSSVAGDLTAAVCLQRMIAASRPFV
ncbi:FUSC family protein [Microbacterium sp. NPDC096154]|uniref:FUSC family protein n=1 Tax=Microbacterium sp. NPDC096154 TaxID=3155549 RepID=UPI00331C7069